MYNTLPKQRADPLEEPGLILAPHGTVTSELVDDGCQGLILLDGEVGDWLRRVGVEYGLGQHVIHAPTGYGLMAASV